MHPEVRRARIQEYYFYRQFICDGDLCFDIGANIGQTIESLLACKARVVAIEPNPHCVQVLNWEFGKCRNITIVEKALGKTTGFADLHFEGTDPFGSVREDWPYPNRESRRVQLSTLDELIAQFGRPKLCKVDVEGYELEVFRGLSQPIPLIRFEFHRDEIQRALDCLARLLEIGEIRSAIVTEMESTQFIYPDFLPIGKFIETLQKQDMLRGNILVKMET